MQQTTPPQRSIRFSGRSFMAFVLAPQPPIAEWLKDFDEFSKRSPGFFAGRPVVVDIGSMPPTRPDLVHMVTELKRRNIVIMGLDGRAPRELGADARGLPPILSGGKEIASLAELGARAAKEPIVLSEAGCEASTAAKTETELSENETEISAESADETRPEGVTDASIAEAALAAVEGAMADPAPDTLILAEPVRSGQSVVHMHGDVIVIGQVASGSEVVASGSIHVYGTLRGRAIAGSNGNRRARIFCSALHAELVAINGLYKTNEDLDADCVGRATQAWLDGDALNMAAFNGKG